MRSISGVTPGPSSLPSPGPRRVRFAVRVLVAGLLFSALGGTGAQAENLQDTQSQLEDQAAQVQESLEFVDSSLVATASQLATYQARMPAAEQTVAEAQSRVAAAAREVDAYTLRISAAEQTLADIDRELGQSRKAMAESQKMVGQIATDAYKRGGVPQDLSLFFGTGDLAEAADSISHTEQALKAQNAAVSEIRDKRSVDENSQNRLSAVRQEIANLKQQAETALKAEQAARAKATAAKEDLDQLITSTTATAQDLAAKKPQIMAELASVKAQQQAIAAQIAENQRREREAWLAEQAAKAQAAARTPQGQNPAPRQAPAPGNPSSFGISRPFGAGVPITSGFGWRATPPGTIDFLGTGSYLHSGIDFGVGCGTPVYAAASGTVTTAGWTNGGGGFTVMVSHGVVQGNALTTILYHNSSVTVSAGQRVDKGQLIAYSGSSGNSTGCHAHFETWLNGSPVDPLGLL
ncbi:MULTISPECIES: murein hydrolase activator EnvC family protein [unclassified Arthrobacter]|uniref:murein hydrolase activator EnvC family protein n=1 Tax=unclassified Arthrobacter TaxID=235627 RepID=UPI002096C0D0|nr:MULTISPECIES: M23 family metallopeptidase [unclassified Arthrobacter]MDD1478597.1 peptidoglycan DD-metalloendopeptidase family protein [Arthrobacter sp. H16F315]MDN4643964.1 peptidoglycan DD-metalloendopeptidase family protein [Arthrobacter sp. PsM3]